MEFYGRGIGYNQARFLKKTGLPVFLLLAISHWPLAFCDRGYRGNRGYRDYLIAPIILITPIPPNDSKSSFLVRRREMWYIAKERPSG